MTEEVLTLKQIQRKLQTKQHVLIHLCEKGVIEPDFQQTKGRGTHREFSPRNLFEFAVALTIRKYEIPVTTTAAIIKLLRSFERSVQKRMKGFNLIDFLQNDPKSNIAIFLYDGQYMVFAIEQHGKFISINGFDLGSVVSAEKRQIKIDHLKALPDDHDSYLKIDLKRISQKAS